MKKWEVSQFIPFFKKMGAVPILLFWLDDNTRYFISNGVLANTSGDTGNHWRFFNNTIFNVRGASQPGISCSSGADNIAYNNIWINCRDPIFYNWTHDYNSNRNSGAWTEPHIEIFSEDPFVDSANHDFRLVMPTLAGIILDPPYDKDAKDVKRGIDNVWDRGAYEYGAEVPHTGDVNNDKIVDIRDVQECVNDDRYDMSLLKEIIDIILGAE